MASEFLEDLGDSDKSAEEPVSTETVEEVATTAPEVTEEPEQTVTPTETGEEGPDENAAPEQKAQWAAVKDEREKRRQALDDAHKAREEAAYYRGLVEQKQRAETETTQPTPEELETEFLSNPIGFLDQRDQALRSQHQQALRDQRVVLTANFMRQTVPDFQEKANAFIELAKSQPDLEQMALDSQDPARFAYEYMNRAQGPVDIEAIKKQAVAEAEVEFRKKYAAQDAASGPKSPAGASGSGGAASVRQYETLDGFLDKQPF